MSARVSVCTRVNFPSPRLSQRERVNGSVAALARPRARYNFLPCAQVAAAAAPGNADLNCDADRARCPALPPAEWPASCARFSSRRARATADRCSSSGGSGIELAARAATLALVEVPVFFFFFFFWW